MKPFLFIALTTILLLSCASNKVSLESSFFQTENGELMNRLTIKNDGKKNLYINDKLFSLNPYEHDYGDSYYRLYKQDSLKQWKFLEPRLTSFSMPFILDSPKQVCPDSIYVYNYSLVNDYLKYKRVDSSYYVVGVVEKGLYKYQVCISDCVSFSRKTYQLMSPICTEEEFEITTDIYVDTIK